MITPLPLSQLVSNARRIVGFGGVWGGWGGGGICVILGVLDTINHFRNGGGFLLLHLVVVGIGEQKHDFKSVWVIALTKVQVNGADEGTAVIDAEYRPVFAHFLLHGLVLIAVSLFEWWLEYLFGFGFAIEDGQAVLEAEILRLNVGPGGTVGIKDGHTADKIGYRCEVNTGLNWQAAVIAIEPISV